MEQGGPAEGLLGVLIDLFTVADEDPAAHADAVREAWARLTRRLDDRIRLHEQLALTQGVEVLAASLVEAGSAPLAAVARDLFAPPAHLSEAAPLPAYAADAPLWVPQGV